MEANGQTNITVNNSFQYCYDMRYPTSSLGNNSLDPHLSTSKDWGGVAYLALSSYGAVKGEKSPDYLRQNGGFNLNSTTGNATGVVNMGANHWGTNLVQTASYIEGSEANEYNSKLYLSSNSRLVDVISATNDAEHTKGMAFAETQGWYNAGQTYPDSGRAIGLRRGVFGYWAGGGGNNYSTQGNGHASNDTTYRPVIWN